MPRFERILAAVDLGPRGDSVTHGSRKAVERATWLAARTGASLTLVHSRASDEYWDETTGTFVDGARGGDAEAVIDALISDLVPPSVKARVALRDEPAWLAIILEALVSRADLVVAGKRTDAVHDERRLGTVARKLVRKCPSAVWLEDPRESRDPSIVLAATDLSPVGSRAVRLGADVANALGAELHVVHAYSLSIEVQLTGGEARHAYEEQQRVSAQRSIEAALAESSIDREGVVLHIGLSSPTQAVLEGVGALEPGLVVMGTVSRGGIPGLLMGNTAERLIDRIDCALLTIKPHDFVCPVEAPRQGGAS